MTKQASLITAWFAIATAITLLGLTAQDGSRENLKEKRWEHLALETTPEKAVSDPDTGQQIRELGDQGWELVSVLNFNTEGTTTRTVYYFKRPK